jgi:hypothetical protein
MILAVAIFSVIVGNGGGSLFIMKITLIFALPVWLIDVPILFLLRNVGRHQRWIVPALGALIGPVCLTLWCGILVLRGDNWLNLWHGDPEAGGLESSLIFASLIGLGTNSFYTVALILRNRHTVPGAPRDDEPGADSLTR